jgi:hypothetical protein
MLSGGSEGERNLSAAVRKGAGEHFRPAAHPLTRPVNFGMHSHFDRQECGLYERRWVGTNG